MMMFSMRKSASFRIPREAPESGASIRKGVRVRIDREKSAPFGIMPIKRTSVETNLRAILATILEAASALA